MKRHAARLYAGLAVLVAQLMLSAQTAYADEKGTLSEESSGELSPARVGQRLADGIMDFTQPLLVAVAGAAAMGAFGQQNKQRLAGVAALTIGIGGFVFAPTSVESVIKGLYGQID